MSTGSSDLEHLLGFATDRGFGPVQLISNHTLSGFSHAGSQAADNLLAKAKRRFMDGDDDRAMTLVDRAVALPYDPHEDAAPAALAARMILFCAVTDEVERASESDPRWLEAALSVLDTAEESPRCELRDVLLEIRQDYQLTKQEERAIDLATRSVPARAQLSDMGPMSPDELRPHVVAILHATIAYERALLQQDSGEGT